MNAYKTLVLVISLAFSATGLATETSTKNPFAGTCVDAQNPKRPVASPDCLKQLQDARSPVLKDYQVVPNLREGKLQNYLFLTPGQTMEGIQMGQQMQKLRLQQEAAQAKKSKK